MKKREKLIIGLLNDERVEAVFSNVLLFYQIYDILYGTNKSTVLKTIYLERHHRGIVAMTLDLFLSDRTLLRYRKEFVDCFYAVMQICGSIEEIAAAWND